MNNKEIIFNTRYEVKFLSPAQNCFHYMWIYCVGGPAIVLYANRDLVFETIRIDMGRTYLNNIFRLGTIKFFYMKYEDIVSKLGKAIRHEIFETNYEIGVCLGCDFNKNYKVKIDIDTKLEKIYAEFLDAGEYTDKTSTDAQIP